MSKFSSVLAAKRESQTEIEGAKPNSPDAQKEAAERSNASDVATNAIAAVPKDDTAKRGRPNAKRSHPDFVQTTAYIRKATHKNVKKALLNREEQGTMDFSELVENLLAGWLAEQ